ncbi:hypothetical protein, partial [Campylobacter jejuni]|uniref:hypothetical protein n=1 Tax=Campylobacter jejuni TaxID=197 RepID=UPI002F966695
FPDDVRFAYQNPKDLILQVHHRILERAFGVENGEPVPAWHEVSNSFAYMVSQANESPIARQWVMMVFVNLEPSRRQSLFRDFRLC